MKRPALAVLGAIILSSLFGGCATSVPRDEAAVVYYNLGNAYFELDKLGKAAEAYREALRLDGSLAAAHYNLAFVFIENGNVEEGREILYSLAEEDPANSILLNTIAYSFIKTNDPAQALDYYNSVLELNPYNSEALYNSAVLLWDFGRVPEARERFLSAYREDQTKMEAVYNLGVLELEEENTLIGIEYLAEYLEKEPGDTSALRLLADAYAAEEYYARALPAYNLITEIEEDAPEVHFRRAEILLIALGDYPAGRAALEQAVQQGFEDRQALSELASAPGLVQPEEIRDYLQRNGLLPSE